jgi:galactofuranosylgalactofuranosylrhamnosyl-N-acetylglucosaminyl-diphospho-decaprenol beta-1,5/1,6-galactofuranosyltransferase
VNIPTNALAIAARLGRGVIHQLKPHDPVHHQRAQINVATQDARCFALGNVGGATVTTADGRGWPTGSGPGQNVRVAARVDETSGAAGA